MPVAGKFEVRICRDEGQVNEDVATEQLELYVC